MIAPIPMPDLVSITITREQASALRELVNVAADRLPPRERVALRAILAGAVLLPSRAEAAR